MARFARYTAGARWYDVLSGERWVYAAGRRAGMELLGARTGDVVIDLGCGTGLNFPGLVSAVGSEGLVIGIDRSPQMLAMAARRVEANGWQDRVRLLERDATALRPDDVSGVISSARGHAEGHAEGHRKGHREGRREDLADALLTTYALSVIPSRTEAWRSAKALLRDGARIVIVDMQPPRGRWRFLSPLARLACAAGGSDITARPWRMLERDAADPPGVDRAERKGRHIVAVGGILAAPDDQAPARTASSDG